jgi:hypothetical protein
MKNLINQILNHPNQNQELLPNNYLKNHLIAINNKQNLIEILSELDLNKQQ